MKTLPALLLLLLPALAPAQVLKTSSPYDSAHYSWRKPVPRDRLRPLRPDRPGVTESPFTVDAGHGQLEVDGLRLLNSGSGDETRSRDWHLAYSMLKLGLTRRTDIQLEVPLYAKHYERPATADKWQERHRGFGDLTLRLKHNFIGDDQKHRVAVAAVGLVQMPSGGPQGAGGVEYGLLLPVNVLLNARWNLDAQVASRLSYDRESGGHYVQLIPSVAVDHEFTDKTGGLLEGVGYWDTQQRRWQSSVNAAFILSLSDNFALDAGTHLALNRITDR